MQAYMLVLFLAPAVARLVLACQGN